jgi:hypothetical protein
MKKFLVFFATALLVALLSASCSGDDSQSNNELPSSDSQGNVGCFEDSGQLIDINGVPYMGSGKVYFADERDSDGQPILTEETMLLTGTVNNGIITLNCPPSVDSRFLMEVTAHPGIEAEPLGGEIWSYTDPLRLIDNSGNHIGDIRYEKRIEKELFAMEYHIISYLYSSGNLRMSGSEGDGSLTIEIDAKKGWNKIYLYMDIDEDYDSGFMTTDLSKAPDGLAWVIHIY